MKTQSRQSHQYFFIIIIIFLSMVTFKLKF